MGEKGQLRIHLPLLLKLSCVDGSAHRYFKATSFFIPLCLMGSLLNIDTELFSFIAATKLPLIRSQRKKNGRWWSVHSISSREFHNPSFRALKFFLQKMLSYYEWKLSPGLYWLAYFSAFLAVILPWVVAVKWALSWEQFRFRSDTISAAY